MARTGTIAGRGFGDRVILGAVIFLAFLWVVPVLWVLILSFKANSELMLSTGSAFRLPYTLKNYSDTIATSGVFRWFFNSVVVASLNTLATLILASLAGYGFARTEFPFKNIIFVIVLLGLAIPEQARF